MSVFISYARQDAAFVRQLCTLLANQGRDPWVDWNDIRPTADWLMEIYAAIEAADAFVFVISPSSCMSRTCGLEVDHAVENHKRLVPILYWDVGLHDVPAPIAKLNWIPFRANDDPEKAASSLANSLDTDLGWVRVHTRLQVRGLEWERQARDDSFLLRGEDLRRALAWLTQASEVRQPAPTALQSEYIRSSQEVEANELERVRGLYERALAGKLAAQSRWLNTARPGAQQLAMALAIESMRRTPSPEAEEALRRCIPLQPKRVARFDHDRPVAIIVFSPKGDVLVTASGSLTEREMFHAEALGKSIEDFVDERDLQRFLDRQNQFADQAQGDSARLWDPLAGTQLARLEHDGSVMAVAFNADGRRAATGAADGTSKVWEIPSGQMICCIRQRRWPWQGTVALSADGSLLITRENNHEACAWDVDSGLPVVGRALAEATRALARDERERHKEHRSRLIEALGRAPRPDLKDCAARLGVSVRSKSTKEELATQIAGKMVRRAITLSSDAAFFADAHRFTSDSDAVSVYDTLGSEVARVAPGGFVEASTFDPSSRYLGTAVGNAVELWNLGIKMTLRFLQCGTDVGYLAFSQDGNYLVAAEAKWFDHITPKADVWDLASGKKVRRSLTPEQRSLLSAASDQWNLASHDNRLIAMRQDPGKVISIRMADSSVIAAELTHNGWIMSAAFGPANLLATGTKLAAHVWSAEDGREIVALEHPDQVRAVAFDTTAKRLATACDDHVARIWEVGSGREVFAVHHDRPVSAVAFSHDGRYLATGGEDATARLWDVATQDEVARLQHKAPVRALCFSPDGQILATGTLTGAVGLWVCRPDTLIDLARQLLTSDLTPTEWNHYLPGEPYRETCQGPTHEPVPPQAPEYVDGGPQANGGAAGAPN
jgi:WD40 repeat protein